MNPSFLTPDQVAKRWNVTTKTLSRWRYTGQGPHYSKVSRHVTYWLSDIEDFELRHRCRCTSEYHTKLPLVSDQTDNSQIVPSAKRKARK
ncbi:MAG: helix-turn-helix domain-containing protein [Alphaproteobacteria bacterium]|nr:helix-turn-helix domain-containing protein [Alphaproteobacteria bacterium]